MQRGKAALSLTAILLLGIALVASTAAAYYIFLRVVIFSITAYLLYAVFKDDEDSIFPWLFLGVAIIFNPIYAFGMSRSAWVTIDVLTIILFASFVIALCVDRRRYRLIEQDYQRRHNINLKLNEIDRAITVIETNRIASTAILQREMHISYDKAKCIIDHLEAQDMVGASDGKNPRKINL